MGTQHSILQPPTHAPLSHTLSAVFPPDILRLGLPSQAVNQLSQCQEAFPKIQLLPLLLFVFED